MEWEIEAWILLWMPQRNIVEEQKNMVLQIKKKHWLTLKQQHRRLVHALSESKSLLILQLPGVQFRDAVQDTWDMIQHANEQLTSACQWHRAMEQTKMQSHHVVAAPFVWLQHQLSKDHREIKRTHTILKELERCLQEWKQEFVCDRDLLEKELLNYLPVDIALLVIEYRIL